MTNRISLIHQAGALRSFFPDSLIRRNGETGLVWEGDLQPSPLSVHYHIKLVYRRGFGVEIFVVSPRLQLAPGTIQLPHVYDTDRQRLCLYYPADREWHPGLYFVHTIIPWASEWLYYYELWLLTEGQWLGGGIEHTSPIPNESTDNKTQSINNQQNGKQTNI